MFSFFKKISAKKCHLKLGSKSDRLSFGISQPSRTTQTGSIMLEVIAVLALMGVMGAMLFRQVYQRNQELHNIQMASEIRTVKEAFSAYIQAERSVLIGKCPTPENAPQPCNGGGSYENFSAYLAGTVNQGIKSYLPDGWFDGGLSGYYNFSLWIYKQNDATQKTVLYGVIVPNKESTLPQTGWNFKRAARVALLLGADGGVYQSETTPEPDCPSGSVIAGALGTWRLCTDDETPTYAAMTGMDIFTPEYELPEGESSFQENLTLGTDQLMAWEYFAAGGTSRANCFVEIGHSGTTELADGRFKVKNDIFQSVDTCKPLFLVDQQNVYVNSDLKVGTDPVTKSANITITKEGVIQQANTKGITIDADGRIISNKEEKTTAVTNTDIVANERFVLDPTYTSNMNDIRLTSRGGARLSEILPNYILKETYRGKCTLTGGKGTSFLRNNGTTTNQTWCDMSWMQLKKDGSLGTTQSTKIDSPTCPTGYNKAILVTPVSFGKLTGIKKSNHTHSLSGNTGNAGTDNHRHSLSGNTGEATINLVNDIKECPFKVTIMLSDITSGNSSYYNAPTVATAALRTNDTKGFRVTMGYGTQSGTNMVSCLNTNEPWDGLTMGTETIEAIAQTYCVWDTETANLPSKDNDVACKSAGFTWTSGSCRYVYRDCATINSGTNDSTPIVNKAAVCKAAGCAWNGTTCSNG